MDEHTIQLLEFGKVRELVASYAPSELGRERVRAMTPSAEMLALEAAQQLVKEMVEAVQQARAPEFSELRDIRHLVRRARAESTLSAENLREIAATLSGLKRLRESLLALPLTCPHVRDFAPRLHELSWLAHEIEARIDSRAQVLDSASRELQRLRNELEKLDERIRSLMQRWLRHESVKRILNYPNYTVTGSHYVLPVAKDHRHEIAGIVHRTSASGDTVFVEPAEVAEMSAELALLRSHEQRELNRILRQLSGEVGKRAAQVLDSLEVAAELCAVYAKAQYARAYHMVPPLFNREGRLCLAQARHPLLEHLGRMESMALVSGSLPADAVTAMPLPAGAIEPLPAVPDTVAKPSSPQPASPGASPRKVVPVDVHLGERFDVLVVTGPNTGGKTVVIKTVGLLALMAQAGMHIPAAEGSTLPVFDQVLADIGDEQSIEQSLSTFSSHVSRIAMILRGATRQSLVLLDELGAGTDPAEGAALGRAVLDHLLDSGTKAMVTTHLGDLKLYALGHPRAENAAVEFDTETLRPTYQLRIGDTGQSSALIIARRLHLPSGVLERAERYLASSTAGRPQEMAVLEQRRAEAEAARVLAWEAEQEARRAKSAFESRLRELDQQAADALALDEFRACLQPGDTVLVRKFRRPGVVQRIDSKRRLAIVSHGSMQWELPLDELDPPESATATGRARTN